MKRKLFIKYFLATAVVVIVCLTLLMMIMTLVYSKYITDSKYETLWRSCNSVADYYEKEPEGINSFASRKKIHFIINNLSHVSENSMFITDSNGYITICDCDEWFKNGRCEHTATAVDTKLLSSIQKSGGRITDLGIYSDQRYVASKKITDSDGSVVGTVVATSPISGLSSLFESIGRIYLFSAIVPLILIFIALYVITNRLTKPLKLMSTAAKAMAMGDFSKRIPVTTNDEIGDLAASFNDMTDSLSRLESMRKTFIADVSHELKTPMTTIGGFIDGIIDGTIEPERQNHYLTLVSGEIKRLSRMVQYMLNIARIESEEFVLKPSRFDFREMVLNVVLSQEQRIASGNIDVIGLDSFESVTINADKDLIHRVVYNLVDNAIKFTDDGGKITFKLKFDSNKLTFSISNTGKGISANDLPYVFERFYKSDRSRSANKNSTGLGLYMAKTIIKKHGGSISVKSKENELTTFSFILPIGE
ncbi:MAG: HAMP domain-containing histidine kinase [Clostridia bacterium]|nr:HAMP domain-containing histidine kinase [Clostridia bacterium]